MNAYGWLQAGFFFALVLALTRPIGSYMARVFSGERSVLSPVFAPVERALYRVCRIDPAREMSATTYLLALFAFSITGARLALSRPAFAEVLAVQSAGLR